MCWLGLSAKPQSGTRKLLYNSYALFLQRADTHRQGRLSYQGAHLTSLRWPEELRFCPVWYFVFGLWSLVFESSCMDHKAWINLVTYFSLHYINLFNISLHIFSNNLLTTWQFSIFCFIPSNRIIKAANLYFQKLILKNMRQLHPSYIVRQLLHQRGDCKDYDRVLMNVSWFPPLTQTTMYLTNPWERAAQY